MKVHALFFALLAISIPAAGQDCGSKDFAEFSAVQSSVLHFLTSPGYTDNDYKTLNAAGDLAAVAIMKTLSVEAMEMPQNRRQILFILRFAFEAPDLIARCNRIPTTALLLLEHLEAANHGIQDNELSNTRYLVKHVATAIQPRVLPSTAAIDWEHTTWVESVLRWTVFLKPGMTRKDVLTIFTTEGGLSNRHQRTYVLKQCPYVKVNVEFAPVGDAQNVLAESPDDKITKISNPYLQFGIRD